MTSEAPQPHQPRPTDWLDNVENIRPSRAGHSAAAVIAAGNTDPESVITIDMAQEKFTETFEVADSTKDPLEMMMIYFRWFHDHFPAFRTDVLQPMLYQVVTRYGTLQRYKNDERIVKLWLELADNFPERGFAVMDLAFSRGSCRGIAKFFIAWARMYEYADQFTRARDILELGVKSRATPLPDLHGAMDGLEVRQMIRTAQRDAAGLDDDDDDEHIEHDVENGRQVFAPVSIIREGAKGFRAPVVRCRGNSVNETPRMPIPMRSTPANTGNGFNVYDEMTTPAKTRTRKPPPVNENEGFEVFTEEPESPRGLEIDPDYMSIFGFHYMKERPEMRISVVENIKTHKKFGGGGVLSVAADTNVLSGFEAYVETAKLKLKFAVRKEIALGLSLEENMLKILESKMCNNVTAEC